MERTADRRVWMLPLLLAIVLGGVVAVRNWRPLETVGKPSGDERAATADGELIEVSIDMGDGTRRTFRAPWRVGATVLDVLTNSVDGELYFAVRGRGAEAFLTELAGIPNQGDGGRNWQFEVNGHWADRSFAIYELQPGDHVLWKFAESE